MNDSLGGHFRPVNIKHVTAASAARDIRAEFFGNGHGDASAAASQFSDEVYEYRREHRGENSNKIDVFVGQVEELLGQNLTHVLKKYAECAASMNTRRSDTSSKYLWNSDSNSLDIWALKSLTELKHEAVQEERLRLHHPKPGHRKDWTKLATELRQKANNSAPQFAMYGDSITAAMDSKATAKAFHRTFGANALNFGIPGDTTENLAYRLIRNGESDFKSADHLKQLVVLIGTNDLLHDKQPKKIAANALANAEYLAEKFPHAKVLLLGLLPRGHFLSKVKVVNKYMSLYAKESGVRNLHFADIGPSMLEDGKMVYGEADTKVRNQLWQAGLVHPTPGPGYDRLFSLISAKISR